MYNKIFTKILDSSIWLEPDATRIVWLTCIAAMDEDGFCCFAAPANLAHRANVSLDACLVALQTLEGPDPNSSDPANEGRRLERVPGGWMVLNANRYREIVTRASEREHTKLRVKRHRAKAKGNAPVTDEALQTVTSNASEAETEAETQEPRASVAAPVVDYDRRDVPDRRVQPRRWGRGVMAGELPADHVRHEVCGRVCLMDFKFRAFVQKVGGIDADQRVRQWAKGVLEAWDRPPLDAQPVQGSDLAWWDARYTEWHGAPATASAAPAGRVIPNAAATAALIASMKAGQ